MGDLSPKLDKAGLSSLDMSVDFPIHMVCPLTISPSFWKRSTIVLIVIVLTMNKYKVESRRWKM